MQTKTYTFANCVAPGERIRNERLLTSCLICIYNVCHFIFIYLFVFIIFFFFLPILRAHIWIYTVYHSITKTYLYNFDPLKPHFYIVHVKLGFTGVNIIFLISAQKHTLWVLVRTASARRF